MRRDRGFTLLEMLVGLVVLGLLIAALSGMVRFTLAAVAQQTDRGAEAAPVRERLTALLGDARPVAAAPGGKILFEGGAQSLILVAPLAAAFGDVGGLQLIRIGLSGGGLQLRWSPFDALATAGGAVELLPNLAELRLRYFGADWQESWHGKTALPKLIRITWRERGQTQGAELLVALQVTSK